MTRQEFSDQFDVFYNNITSNQAPGLDEYEKSVFLTRAQDEIIKDYFTPGTNKLGAGFDDTERRQIDFSMLINVVEYQASYPSTITTSGSAEYRDYIDIQNTVLVKGRKYITNKVINNGTVIFLSQIVDVPSTGTLSINNVEGAGNDTIYSDGNIIYIVKNHKWELYTINMNSIQCSIPELTAYKDTMFDFRSNSIAVELPDNIMMMLNEQLKVTRKSSHASTQPSKTVYLQVIPIAYTEYSRLMMKPYKRPNHYQAWRLSNYSNDSAKGNFANLILGPNDTMDVYMIRYVRRPKPIILEDLQELTIDNEPKASDCELDPILHQEILQRAVELAKLAWLNTGEQGSAGAALAQAYGIGQSGTPIGQSAGR